MDKNNYKEDLIKSYRKANDILTNKDNKNIEEKYDAWRQQLNIITQLCTENESVKHDLLEKHIIEQQQTHFALDGTDFIKQRLQNIKNIEDNFDVLNSNSSNAFSNISERAFPELSEITKYHTKGDVFEQINLSTLISPQPAASNKKSQADASSLIGKSNELANFKTAAQIMKDKQGSLCRTNTENQEKQTVQPFFNYGLQKKSLGARLVRNMSTVKTMPSKIEETKEMDCSINNPALKCFDIKIIELITNEIIQKFKPVKWHEIAGLEYAKSVIKEAVVYPLLRPDIFTGLRRPPRGILLFGPPGTGKTLIGKCIASESKSTFFNISASSLTSKWVGESEKLVRALFAVAVERQPSIIFIDEVDSLLAQRSDNENECTRRLKTEFLVRLDGATTLDSERILIVGATNRPQELDEAVRRRFIKRLYVPLPEYEARLIILKNSLEMVSHNISLAEFEEIAKLTEGYSGADMDSLCREASMEPLRSISIEDIETFDKNNLRPVNFIDVKNALMKVRPSVSQQDLQQYVDWNKTYGSYI